MCLLWWEMATATKCSYLFSFCGQFCLRIPLNMDTSFWAKKKQENEHNWYTHQLYSNRIYCSLVPRSSHYPVFEYYNIQNLSLGDFIKWCQSLLWWTEVMQSLNSCSCNVCSKAWVFNICKRCHALVVQDAEHMQKCISYHSLLLSTQVDTKGVKGLPPLLLHTI